MDVWEVHGIATAILLPPTKNGPAFKGYADPNLTRLSNATCCVFGGGVYEAVSVADARTTLRSGLAARPCASDYARISLPAPALGQSRLMKHYHPVLGADQTH